MFVYQNNKLFVETKGVLVGVNITPAGITLVDETTTFSDGSLLTDYEVACRFGEYYTFPSEVGEDNVRLGEIESAENSAKRGRPRK